MGYQNICYNLKNILQNRQTTAQHPFQRKIIEIKHLLELIDKLESEEFDDYYCDRDKNDPLLDGEVSMAYVTAGELRRIVKGKQSGYVFLMGADHLQESFLVLSRNGNDIAKPIKVRRIFRSTIDKL